MEKNWWINGSGMVMGPVAESWADYIGRYLSSGTLTISKATARRNDHKTERVKRIVEKAKIQGIDDRIRILCASRVEDSESMQNFRNNIGKIDGYNSDIKKGEIFRVIDGTDKSTPKENVVSFYNPLGIPFTVNGGAPNDLIKNNFFVSAPGSESSKDVHRNIYGNKKVVSCNSTATLIFLGLLDETLRTNYGLDVSELTTGPIYELFDRRTRDRGCKKEMSEFVDTKKKQYHVDEIESLHPSIKGHLQTSVAMWPTEYFHRLEFVIPFRESVLSDKLFKDLEDVIVRDSRSLYMGGDLSQSEIMNASELVGYKDGRFPFPSYSLRRVGDMLIVFGATPQRDIVGPSLLDYMVICSEILPKTSQWEDIRNYTNQNFRYQGIVLGDGNRRMQDILDKKRNTSSKKSSFVGKEHLRSQVIKV